MNVKFVLGNTPEIKKLAIQMKSTQLLLSLEFIFIE